MSDRRWFDPRQPQTLQIATMLLYFHAVLSVILIGARFGLVFLAIAVASGLGAYGMANERKWGYNVSVVAAIGRLIVAVALYGGIGALLSGDPIGAMVQVAVVALLLHPQSRDYQRIWYS